MTAAAIHIMGSVAALYFSTDAYCPSIVYGYFTFVVSADVDAVVRNCAVYKVEVGESYVQVRYPHFRILPCFARSRPEWSPWKGVAVYAVLCVGNDFFSFLPDREGMPH